MQSLPFAQIFLKENMPQAHCLVLTRTACSITAPARQNLIIIKKFAFFQTARNFAMKGKNFQCNFSIFLAKSKKKFLFPLIFFSKIRVRCCEVITKFYFIAPVKLLPEEYLNVCIKEI